MPYVEAAATLGLSPWRLMIRHIWPNLLPLVMANTFLNFAFSLVSLAGLSFLGLGVPLNTPRLGRPCSRRTCRSSRATRWPAWRRRSRWSLTATSMNLIGDWVYERLSDRGRAR